MRRAIMLGLIIFAALFASTAIGSVSHIFGRGGKAIKFDAACHRPSWASTNSLTIKQGQNVVTQQARCLVRRPDPFARCVRKLGPAPTVEGKFDHGPGKPGDWSGVDDLQAYVAAVAACSTAKY